MSFRAKLLFRYWRLLKGCEIIKIKANVFIFKVWASMKTRSIITRPRISWLWTIGRVYNPCNLDWLISLMEGFHWSHHHDATCHKHHWHRTVCSVERIGQDPLWINKIAARNNVVLHIIICMRVMRAVFFFYFIFFYCLFIFVVDARLPVCLLSCLPITNIIINPLNTFMCGFFQHLFITTYSQGHLGFDTSWINYD